MARCRHATMPRPPAPALAAGLALGFCGALGQAGGLVLSKLGHGGLRRRRRHPGAGDRRHRRLRAPPARRCAAGRGVGRALRDRRALGFAAVGAFFGPFLGVSLSLYAVRHTVAGVAASIMALQPVLVIPLVVLLHRERVGVGGVAGALVAVAGVALLFL